MFYCEDIVEKLKKKKVLNSLCDKHCMVLEIAIRIYTIRCIEIRIAIS